jgi:hypothetical protein
MKKTVLICGIIAGLITTSMFLGQMILGIKHDFFENGMIYGYTLMILAFAFIFVATKITRDKHNGGQISFGKAFRVGLYVTLIASTIYVGVWLIDYYFFNPDFMEKYSAHVIDKLKASGASEAEINKQTTEMAKFSEMYKNPLFNALLTYSEIVPVGLLVSVISALILKKKSNRLPAGAQTI